jgi:hypothetical protein
MYSFQKRMMLAMGLLRQAPSPSLACGWGDGRVFS